MPAPALDKVMRLAARHHATGRLREAAAIYRRVLQQEPRNADALHALGIMAWQTGRGDASEKLLLRAVEADPHHAAARDDLGALHFLLGRIDEALAEFDHAVMLDPALSTAHAHRGAALAKMGRLEDAVAAYQRAVDAGLLGRRRRHVGIDLRAQPEADIEPDVPPQTAIEPEVRAPTLTLVEPPPMPVAGEVSSLPFAPAISPEQPAINHSAPADAPLPIGVFATDRIVATETVDANSLPFVAEPHAGWQLAEPHGHTHQSIPAQPQSPDSGQGLVDAPSIPFLDAEPEPLVPLADQYAPVIPAAVPATAMPAVAQPRVEPVAVTAQGSPPIINPPVAVALALPADGIVTFREWDLSVQPDWLRTPAAQVELVAVADAAQPAGLLGEVYADEPPPFDEVPDPGADITEEDLQPAFVESLTLSDDGEVVSASNDDADIPSPGELLRSGPAAALNSSEATAWSTVQPGSVSDAEAFAVTHATAPSPEVAGDSAESAAAEDAVDLSQDDLEAEVPEDRPAVRTATKVGEVDPLLATRMLSKEIRRARRAPTDDARRALGLYKEASALLRQRRLDEAIDTLTQLVEIHPGSAKAFRDLGVAYLRANRLDEAAAALNRAVQIRPKFGEAYASLGDIYHLQGKADDAVTNYRKAVALRPSSDKTHSNLLLTLNYHRRLAPEALFEEHVRWANQHAKPLMREMRSHANKRDPERPIKIGYVSADFRRHSVTYFVEPLLARRDPNAFHVTCYSDVARSDDVTEKLRKSADRWADVKSLRDADLAELIRSDGIDILIDLAGHTGGNRLGVFARKPAPVQVTYLGYPNTTGLATIDYRLTDNAADPTGVSENVHTESLVRLPNFLCYAPPAEAPAISVPPSVASGKITFGCFNVLAKMTPEVLGLWARLLNALPNSRLVLKDRNGAFANAARRRYVQDIFTYHRVNADRLELLDREPDVRGHLASYAKVDVVLDPFPYNGTTTTCEALWMGVPVVTLAGNRHAARVGVSILTAAGLTEFIANTPETYVRTALAIAKDAARLALLRRTLRQRLAASHLMDQKRFMTTLERVYREMWRWWCKIQDENTPTA